MVAPSPPLTIADEGQRLRRLTRVLFAAVWVVPAGLSALQFAFVGDASGTHYDLGTALLWQGTAWMIWGLWSQVILTLVDRVKLDTARLMPWLALHLTATAVVCAANVLTIAWLDHLFGAIGQVTSYRFALRVAVVNHLDIQVVLYWAIRARPTWWSSCGATGNATAPPPNSNRNSPARSSKRCACSSIRTSSSTRSTRWPS
jgi:hypothetical protein